MKHATKILVGTVLSAAITSVLAAVQVTKTPFTVLECVTCKNNCVDYVKYKIKPLQLPTGLTYFSAKKAIINRETIQNGGNGCKAGFVAIISVTGQFADNGHVAYVENCNNGGITITEGNLPVGQLTNRTCSASILDCEKAFNIVGYYDPSATPNPTLDRIGITCPSSLDENSTGICFAKAYYTNGTNKPINASWNAGGSSVLSIGSSSGSIVTKSVTSNTNVTIAASYSEGSKTVSGKAIVTVNDLPDWSGKSPIGTVCDKDSQVVNSKAGKYGTLELRWSNTCKTNWARIVSNSSTYNTTATVMRNSDSLTYSTNPSKGSIVTNMVYGSGIRVCVSGTINGESLSGVCR